MPLSLLLSLGVIKLVGVNVFSSLCIISCLCVTVILIFVYFSCRIFPIFYYYTFTFRFSLSFRSGKHVSNVFINVIFFQSQFFSRILGIFSVTLSGIFFPSFFLLSMLSSYNFFNSFYIITKSLMKCYF